MLSKQRIQIAILLIIFHFSVFLSNVFSQQESNKRDQYFTQEEESKLKILVHIWGEVTRPGEYLVSDGTNVLELISKAGGPTEYSNLKNIELTRGELGSSILSPQIDQTNPNQEVDQIKFTNTRSSRIIKIDIKKYLKNKNYLSLPILQPGDVIKVNRNHWYSFETFIKILAQVAIIAQTWYYYSELR